MTSEGGTIFLSGPVVLSRSAVDLATVALSGCAVELHGSSVSLSGSALDLYGAAVSSSGTIKQTCV